MAASKKELEAMATQDAVDVLVGEFISGERLILGSNYKLQKSGKLDIRTIGLTLAPATDSIPYGGINTCVNAGHCAEACLKYSGHNVIPYNHIVKIARTVAMHKHSTTFKAQCERELSAHIRFCESKGIIPAFRPNMMSDVIKLSRHFARKFPSLQVYDYTKVPGSIGHKSNPSNLHLTLSRDETNESKALDLLASGHNVAVVFASDSLPATWQGFPVIDGDEHDVRFLDAPGSVVGLRLKGTKAAKQVAIESGFAVSPRSSLRIVA